MMTQCVKIIDQSGTVIAVAQVEEKAARFSGEIDLSPMPDALRRKFEEYEEIVNGQMFSFLDAIEEQISSLFLKVVLGNGSVACAQDLQIYPESGTVSFKVCKEEVPHAS